MFIDLNPRFLFLYFENGLHYDRAKKLSSRTLVRCNRFLYSQTYRHNSENTCYCYKCWLDRLLIDLLHQRGRLPLIFVIAQNNCRRSSRYIVEFGLIFLYFLALKKCMQWKCVIQTCVNSKKLCINLIHLILST